MTDPTIARAQSFAMLIDLGTKLQVLADRELGASGFTTRQWFLCLVLEQAGVASLSLTDVARRMGTSRQNAKQLALKLSAKGYLTIAPDDKDGRGLRIALTNACRAFWAARTAEDHRLLAAVFGDLDAAETARLQAALKTVNLTIHRLLEAGSQAFAMEEP